MLSVVAAFCLPSCFFMPSRHRSNLGDFLELEGDSRDQLIAIRDNMDKSNILTIYEMVPNPEKEPKMFDVRTTAEKDVYEIKILGAWKRVESDLSSRVINWLPGDQRGGFQIEGWLLLENPSDVHNGEIVAIALNGGPLFFRSEKL